MDENTLRARMEDCKTQLLATGDTCERAARDQGIAALSVPVQFDPHYPTLLESKMPWDRLLDWERFSINFRLTSTELRPPTFVSRLHALLTSLEANGTLDRKVDALRQVQPLESCPLCLPTCTYTPRDE